MAVWRPPGAPPRRLLTPGCWHLGHCRPGAAGNSCGCAHASQQVHVCGSFTNWLTPIPMAPDGSGGGNVFAVVCNLPPGCAPLSQLRLGHTAQRCRVAPASGSAAASGRLAGAVPARIAKPLCLRAAPPGARLTRRLARAQLPSVQVHRGRQVATRGGSGVRHRPAWQHKQLVSQPAGSRARALQAPLRRAAACADARTGCIRLFVKRPEAPAAGGGAWAHGGRAAPSGVYPQDSALTHPGR